MQLKKIYAKINNKHFFSLAGNGIMSVFSIVTIAVLYRALSISEIGIWVFFQSTLLLVDTFRSGFLTTAFIKFYAGTDKRRAAEVAGSAWYIASVITGSLFLLNIPAFLFFREVNNAGLSLFFEWFGITYISTLPMYLAICVVQAELRFDRLFLVRLINQGLFILFIILLIILQRVNLQYVIYANLAAGLITSAFTVMTGWSMIHTFKSKTKKAIRELYHFGKFSVGTNISANLFRTTDTFIINFMLGPAALAIYNLGQRLMEVVEIPIRSFGATAMPSLSVAYNQNSKDEVIYIMKKYTGMLTVALVPVAVASVLLADVAVLIIGGEKYVHTEAANVLRLFMTFGLLYPADRYLALTLDVANQPRINFIKVLVMLAANVIFDFLGIYIFGNIYGVALATVVPILIGVSVGYWALQKFRPFRFFSIYTLGFHECRLLTAQYLRKKKV